MSARGRAWVAAGLVALLPLALPAGEDADAARGHADAIPAATRAAMDGVSWHAAVSCGGRRRACPPLDELRLLTVPYRSFEGARKTGRLVVRADVAEAVLDAFAALYRAGFPIARMEPVERFDGDDRRSMAANNTSAFNCRCTTGGTRLSAHATGRAVDLNPLQNPYVAGDRVLPETGRAYVDREDVRAGMVVEGGPALRAFEAVGWRWGGRWKSARDYQHFSRSGR